MRLLLLQLELSGNSTAFMMKISVFTAGLFSFEDRHVKRIMESCPSASVSVAGIENELFSLLPESEILICGNYNFRESWLGSAPKLKWIQSIAAGNEKILSSLVGRPVLLTDASGVHSVPIAEQVLGYVLMFERKFAEAVRAQQRKEWLRFNPSEYGELCAKTVLVVGLGAVGRGIAKVCKAVGMNVMATKRTISSAAVAEAKGVVDELHAATDLVKLLGKADYVVLSLPYTKETHRIFGGREFAAMKPTAHFVNIARGGVVDESALIAALKGKKIAGAALDVFEQEPLPKESPLWSMGNVIITPHSAGFTPRYMDRVVDIFCSNLKAYVEKKPMQNLVDKVKGY